MANLDKKRGTTGRENSEVDKAYKKVSGAAKRPSARQVAERQRAARNRKIAIISICSVILVVLIGLIIGMIVYASRPKDDGRILNNVYAAGINLSGMTEEEAKNALHLATDNTFTRKDMVIILPDATITLSPTSTGAKLDVDKVVQAAYNYGRDGTDAENKKIQQNSATTVHTIALLGYMQLDTTYIQNALKEFCDSYSSTMTNPSFNLKGERPTFDPENPDQAVSHQTLVITMGTPDYRLDYNRLYERVLDAYSLNEMELTYAAPTQTEPEKPSAQALFDQYCTLAQDASLDEHLNIQPEVYGYGFDVDALQKRIDKAGYGDVLQVDMKFLLPHITAEDLQDSLPVDKLGEFSCPNPSATNGWMVNMALACEKINNLILNTGDEFSFNDLVGRLTAVKGYQKAPGYRGGVETEILGAGVEQVASALYYCALMSDLEILERHGNGYATNYTAPGLDAYISWGSQDLRFVNNTGSPIRIEATVEGNTVSVTIYGIDNRQFDVEIVTDVVKTIKPNTSYQKMAENNKLGYKDGHVLVSGITGYEVNVYRVKRNKQTGDLVSKTLVNNSVYSSRDQQVVMIVSDTVVDPDLPGENPDDNASLTP